MDNSRVLHTESCGKLLWKFSAPAMIGMLANALYDVVDRLFIGQAVGVLGISAITVVRPFFIILLAFSLLVGVGTSVTISLKLGQNNKLQAEQALGNALVLAVIISFVLMLFGLLFREQLLIQFGASKEVLPLARGFFTIFLLGTVFQITAHILSGAARAEGNPKIAMFSMLLGSLINLVLNPIFIFVLDLGIVGSALATFCSQCIITALLIIYYIGGNSVLKLKIKNLLPDTYILNQIIHIGMASFLDKLVSSITLVILNKNLAFYGGDYAVAALGIMQTLTMLIMLPVVGINQGMQPIVGYNYGAGNFHRVKKTVGIALLSSTYITTIGFILMQLFQTQLFSLFSGHSEELLKIGTTGMGIFLLMLPIVSIQRIEYFDAVGSARVSTFLNLSKQLIFQIPLLFILPRLYNIRGVWLTGAISDFFSSLLSGVFILWALGQLKERTKPSFGKMYTSNSRSPM
jgi:putative MATE family efflux protein